MIDKSDLVLTACTSVKTTNGKRILGIRDLFDIREGSYDDTTLMEKLEIVENICNRANCKFIDIFNAFIECYDRNGYEHIIIDSFTGVLRLYFQKNSIELPESTRSFNSDKLVLEIIKINDSSESFNYIRDKLKTVPENHLSSVLDSWDRENYETLTEFIYKAAELY